MKLHKTLSVSTPGTAGSPMRDRLLVGAASNYAGKVTSVTVSFLLTPFLLTRLGPTAYGLWVLIGSVAYYGWMLDLGLGGAVVKYVAEHDARGEREDLRKVMATAQWLYLGLGVGAFVVALLFAPLFPRLFQIPRADWHTAQALVILTGLTVAVAVTFTATTSILQGLQRYEILNAIFIGATLMQAAGIVIVVLCGGGVLGIVAVNIPFEILIRTAHIVAIRRVAPNFPWGWRGIDRKAFRCLLSFSTSLFAMDVAKLNAQTDGLLIGALRPLGDIAPYWVARKLSSSAQIVSEQFLKILMPAASQLGARGNRGDVRRMYIVGTRITLAVFVPIALALMVLSREILTVWVGASYAVAASHVVIILTLASLVTTSQWPAASVLQGIARHRLLGITSVVAVASGMVMTVLLIGRLGLEAVALANLVPAFLAAVLVTIPYTMRILEVPFRQALKEIWLPALLPAIPAVVIFIGLQQLLRPASLVMVGVVAAGGAVAYVVAYLALPSATLERSTLVELFTELSRLGRAALPS